MAEGESFVPGNENAMRLADYARVLRGHLRLLMLCPLLASLAALGLSLVMTPIYQAQVSLLVRPAQPLASDPSVASLTSDQISRTYATLMVERPLLANVIRELQLNMTVTDLAKQITVTPEPNTTILDVSVRDSDPSLARDIANRLVGDFVAEVRGIQQQETTDPNGRSADNLVVVSPAVTPDHPISPDLPLNVALALVAGIVVGVGFAFLVERLDQSVRGDEDVSARFGLAVLGHLPARAAAKERRGELLALKRDSPDAEGYKTLRTNLLFSSVDREVKSLVVTSPGAGEGKSRTSANLAIALAEAGYVTLLVDGDFRRPSQHRLFGRVRNAAGFSNLIVQELADSEVVTPVEGILNLWLLPSGPTPPNPSELLGSQRVRALLKALRRFDYLIIDAPPLNAVADASILAAHADASLLVVEHGKTTHPAVRQAKQSLDRVGARTLGVVMNKMHLTSGAYAYVYGSTGSVEPEPNGQLKNGANGTRRAGTPQENGPAAVVTRGRGRGA